MLVSITASSLPTACGREEGRYDMAQVIEISLTCAVSREGHDRIEQFDAAR